MLKVLIVDDERRIVEMIRQLVDWEELGFEVAAVAYNGPDAFELIESLKPDVVIADVRMPGYDGVELIRRCHDARRYPSFIIVSGYRFFEYAHNALQFGVEHYLLKPLEKRELVHALETIRRKRDAEEERRIHEESIHSQLDESVEALRRRFVTDCLLSRYEPASAESANADYGTAFAPEGSEYTAVCSKLLTLTGVHMNLKPILTQLLEVYGRGLSGVCTDHVAAVSGGGVLAVVNYLPEKREELKRRLEDIHRELRKRTDIFGHFEVATGLGLGVQSIGDIQLALNSARTAVRYSLDEGTESVLVYDAEGYVKQPVSKFFTLEVERLFLDAVATNETENIRKYYCRGIDRINEIPRRCPSMIYGFVCSARDSIVRYIGDSQLDRAELEPGLERLDELLDRRCGAAELAGSALDEILKLSELISRQRYLEYSRPIRIARRYVEEHYMEQISLEELAEMVHLSSSYLSTVFKDEIGVGFSEYLINCRISAAKKLLRETDLNLSQISYEIGYLDAKHFSKLFKKLTGIKPGDYRKLYS